MVCFVALATRLAERRAIVPSCNMSAIAIAAFEIIIPPVLVGSNEGVSFAPIAHNYDFVASVDLQTSMHLSYVRSEIWRSFLRTLLSVISQTILSRIISSFNTRYSNYFADSDW